MIYYGLVYSVPFESATSEEDVPEFVSEYNTQIRSCNMQNGEEEVLYTYNAKHYIEISDMCCNGETLVWEDYNVDDTWWRVQKMELSEPESAEVLFDSNSEGKEFSAVTLSLTENELYWYNMNQENKHPIELWCYNLETQEKEMKQSALDTTSPYEHMNVVKDNCVTYKEEQDGKTTILVSDEKGRENRITVAGEVSNPICDGRYCAWMGGYDYIERDYVMVYDLKEGELQKIDGAYVFSYGLVNECVILNREDGLWAYDLAENTKELLLEGDGVTCCFTTETSDGNLYMDDYAGHEGSSVIYSLIGR